MLGRTGRGTSRGRWCAVTATVVASGVFGAGSLGAQNAADLVREEAAYAATITRVADSAIHWLDFFLVRSQVRVQMLFSVGRDSLADVDAIRAVSVLAASAVDEMMRNSPPSPRLPICASSTPISCSRFATHVPGLHRLSSSAGVCRIDARSCRVANRRSHRPRAP